MFLVQRLEAKGADVIKMFWYLIVTAGFLCVLHLICNYNDKARKIRKMPGPKDSFILGNGPAVMRSSGKIISMSVTIFYLL